MTEQLIRSGAEAHAKEICLSFRCAENAACFSAAAARKMYLEEVLCCASKRGYPSEYATPEALRDAVDLLLHQLEGIYRSKALHMLIQSNLSFPKASQAGSPGTAHAAVKA